MRTGILGGVGALLAAASILAQTPPAAPQGTPEQPAQPTFRTGIGLVRVDVTVSGRDDRPIDDLTADEFDVREDGVPQAVETLQFVRLTGRRAPDDDMSLEIRSPEHAAAEAARDDVRLLVVFLDDYHLRYGPLFDYRLKGLLRGFIAAEMRETDLFAVMGPLTPIEDLGLTRNKQDLFDRIERLQGRLGGFVPPRSALEENQMQLGDSQRGRIRAQITLSALESLANYLGALREGRKSVLFVSEGPPLDVDRSELFGRLRDVVTAANRSNVTIHTLDPRQLGESRGRSAANEMLSLDTGGRRLAQSNDYSQGLRAVMADASAYYLLGYAPKRPVADGKFHAIEVKIKRKGLRVLARKGYWAPTLQETRARTPVPAKPSEIAVALGQLTAPPGGRGLDWWLGFDRAPGGGTRATFTWEPPEGGRTQTRGAAARVSIDVGAGLALEKHMASADRADDPRGPWQVVFRTTPGRQALHIRAEADDGGTVDEWTENVVVPDLSASDAVLGTLRVYRASTAGAWRTLSANPDAATPIASRRLRRTDRVLVTIPLSAGGAAATLRAELLSTQGKALVKLPVSQPDADQPPRLELPLSNLAQAEYVLRVAAERAGGDAVTQAMAFVVVP